MSYMSWARLIRFRAPTKSSISFAVSYSITESLISHPIQETFRKKAVNALGEGKEKKKKIPYFVVVGAITANDLYSYKYPRTFFHVGFRI